MERLSGVTAGDGDSATLLPSQSLTSLRRRAVPSQAVVFHVFLAPSLFIASFIVSFTSLHAWSPVSSRGSSAKAGHSPFAAVLSHRGEAAGCTSRVEFKLKFPLRRYGNQGIVWSKPVEAIQPVAVVCHTAC